MIAVQHTYSKDFMQFDQDSQTHQISEEITEKIQISLIFF